MPWTPLTWPDGIGKYGAREMASGRLHVQDGAAVLAMLPGECGVVNVAGLRDGVRLRASGCCCTCRVWSAECCRCVDTKVDTPLVNVRNKGIRC